MDIQKILNELRAERENIEQAIISIERLGASQGKRRGRPPAWLKEASATTPEAPKKRRGRPKGSKNQKAESAG